MVNLSNFTDMPHGSLHRRLALQPDQNRINATSGQHTVRGAVVQL